MRKPTRIIFMIMICILLSGCYKPGPGAKPWSVSDGHDDNPHISTSSTDLTVGGGEATLPTPSTTPTPNPPITLPTPRTESVTYTIQQGDFLRSIAQKYQVSIDQIVTANDIENPNLIDVNQVIEIPPPSLEDVASAFKIIPDSELVNSPSNADFNVEEFIHQNAGYLSTYSEIVDDNPTSGSKILERVALEYSINPRLLLTILEYQSGWVTKSNPKEETLVYPLRFYEIYREGLYEQLAWAANLLNEGYYLWKINAITSWMLSDGRVLQVDPTINPGTAGVLNLMRYLTAGSEWEHAVSDQGVYATFYRLFGYPFNFTFYPLVPDNLTQPELQLPFEKGQVWSFTGGPHGGWNTGAAWAALDFAPPGEALGCYSSDAWVVASAPGEVVYSDHGAVIQDLDGDGIWQTGWSILYMHMDTSDRVKVGTMLDAGDRVGHPSCEGGFSTGTHLHIARRYNGEWIAADGELPLNLEGWVAVGYGVEYDGYLVRDDVTLEAWNGRASINAIER